MKIVFVGPSLPHAESVAKGTVEIRAPACQGDIVRALEDGATAIGLIDGQFEFVAPVWHKELLFALSRGVPVLGAASMGALRAVECQAYGMVGIGRIFKDYASGLRDDDADVVLLHGPPELDYPALSVPLVNVDATLETAVDRCLVGDDVAQSLRTAARNVFFKDRTWRAIARAAAMDAGYVKGLVEAAWTDQKQLDAMALLDVIEDVPPVPHVGDWCFNATPLWRKLFPQSHRR